MVSFCINYCAIMNSIFVQQRCFYEKAALRSPYSSTHCFNNIMRKRTLSAHSIFSTLPQFSTPSLYIWHTILRYYATNGIPVGAAANYCRNTKDVSKYRHRQR